MSIVLDEYAEHLAAAGCSNATIAMRLQLLCRLNRHLRLGLLFGATAQIEGFLAALRTKGLKRSTLNNYVGYFRGFYSWADSVGYLDGDPTLSLRRSRGARFRPKPLAPEQVAVALCSPEPWHTVFALAYFEGLRAGEIADCRREDFTEEWTYIPKAKGGDPATVPTHPYVWKLVCHRSGGRLFPVGSRGGKVDGAAVSQGARRQLRRLGFKASVHQLRHSFATHQLLNGVDIRTVQENLRHASLATTSAYLEVTSARRRAAVASLPIPGPPASR